VAQWIARPPPNQNFLFHRLRTFFIRDQSFSKPRKGGSGARTNF
jgi:hypothetical protein